MPPAPPKVQLSGLLRQALVDEGLDPDDFAHCFAEWKALGPPGEFSSFYFGKDGFYERPKRCGRRVLQHVHMAPADPEEGHPPSQALTKWEATWERRGRKTSDTSLIYAYDPAHGYLLIHLAREPDGHSLASMSTPALQELMGHFADIAEQFIFSGTIIL